MSNAPPNLERAQTFNYTTMRVVLLYAFFAALWITISNNLLEIIVDDPVVRQYIEIVNAIVFIFVTGILLYLLLKDLRISPDNRASGKLVKILHLPGFGRLLVFFIVLTMIVPFIGLAIVKLYVPQTERNTYQNLQSIAKLKNNAISDWINERGSDTRALAADTGFAKQVELYLRDHSPDSPQLGLIQRRLEPLHSIYGYDTILLLDTKGNVLTKIGNDTDEFTFRPDLVKKALLNNRIMRTDMLRDKSNHIGIYWIVPVTTSDGNIEAAAVLRVNPNRFLYPLIKSWPTLSASAETLLVRKEGSFALFINELRHRKNTELKLKLALNNPTLPASVAITSNRPGTIQGEDYRGVKVLAAYRPVTGTDWFIVAKIDRKEILQPVWRMLQWVMLISLIAVSVIMTLLILLWRKQQNTHRLELVAEKSKAIEESERRFRAVTLSATEAIITSDSKGIIVNWNPGAEHMFGYSQAEIIGQPLSVLMPERYRGTHFDHVTKASAKKELNVADVTRELVGLRRSGDEFPLELSLASWEMSSGVFFTGIIRDISNRKANEVKIQRLTQIYAALSHCNKTIVRCNDEQELFERICHVAVKYGRMKMAWVGRVNHDTGRIEPVASSGAHTEYLENINITLDKNSENGQGPTATAALDDKPYWCNDFMRDPATLPWRVGAIKSGWKSSAAIPLHREGEVVAIFTLYSADINAFDKQARELLLEMVSDISYALDNLVRVLRHQKAEQENYALSMRYQALMQTSFDGIHVMNGRGDIVEANDAFCHMLGYTQEEMARLNVTDWDAQWSDVELQDAFSEFVGKSALIETVHRRKDGTLINVEISASGVELGGSKYFFGASRDVTERKKFERELQIAATTFEMQEGILVSDENLVILRVNEAFQKLFGYGADEIIGQTPSMIKSDRHDDEFYREMWSTLKHKYYWQGEIWNKRKDNKTNPYWVTITAVINDEGKITNYIGAYSDLAQYKQAEAEIHSLAFYDQLTNLPNRRLLINRLKKSLNSSDGHKHYGAIMFIDLDNFKSLNDTRGHMVGDMLLIEVARRLKETVRDDDVAARLGGDEFVVVLENLSPDAMQAAAQANVVSEKILTAIREPFQLQDEEYRSSTSIGITLFRGYETTVDELLKHADIAMYHAKSDGRNTLRFYDPAMQDELESRIALENDLHMALSENQFELYYQMQVDNSGQVVGAEALIRWQHPLRGTVSPMQFIPLAEQTGQILPIGEWALEVACKQLKTWEADPKTRDLKLAVNVSARQFHQPDFVEQVTQTIVKYKIKPDRLKLELTESLVLDNTEDTIIKMHELRRTGVLFSMDDFGTGYSSLSYLTQLPLDQLKIDQSFVRNIMGKRSDAAIVQTIIGMAHSLDIEVIAEGVETEQQRAFLEAHGCYTYQGYLFGRPVPIKEFVENLKVFV